MAAVAKLQVREMTRPELLMQANWHEALREFRRKDPSKFPEVFELPDIVFEEENLYMPDFETLELQGLTPETYEEFENIFNKLIIPDFNKYRLTQEFVDNAVSSIWDIRIYTDLPEIMLGKSGEFITISNDADIVQRISSNEMYKTLYESVKKVIVHYNTQFIENDIIIYVNCHGRIEKMLAEHTLDIIDTHDMKVTFISFAKLGECSFSRWPEMYTFIHELFDGIEFKGVNIQQILHKLWRRKLKTPKKNIKTTASSEHGKDFLHQLPDEGWNIYTKCSERIYEADRTFVPLGVYYLPFEVLYDARGLLERHDIFEELKSGLDGIVRRSQLLEYLYEKGYKHPLFVDISCAETDDKRLTHTELRALRRVRRAYLPSSVSEGVAGGKRKTRRNKKRKSRKKSNKLVHI